jgi:hypothetical protein
VRTKLDIYVFIIIYKYTMNRNFKDTQYLAVNVIKIGLTSFVDEQTYNMMMNNF